MYFAVARRIGVRAQFGETAPASWVPGDRIGIRPQICYSARPVDAGVNAGVTRRRSGLRG